MEIKLARIDERLVHGQVITSWTRKFEIVKIIVIDDEICKDDFMSSVLTMAAPTGVDVLVKSVRQTAEMLEQSISTEKTMLLFKDIKYALELVKAGYKLQDLNVGNIGSGPGRKAITKRVYMSDDEVLVAKDLVKFGVNVYLQMLYSDAKVDITTLI